MEISGSYSLSAPREQVWSALLDPDIIKRALPGCESLEQTGATTYTARLNVDVAQVRGAYDGVARVLETQQPESFRLIVDATGTRGIFHGDGIVQLEAQDTGATVVRYSGQAQLGGAIASMGAQVARGAASMLLKQYFARLANLLPATPVPVAVAVSATPEPVSAMPDMPDMAAMPESSPMQQASASEMPPAMPLTPASPFVPEAETRSDPSPLAAPADALMPPPTAPIAPPAAPPPATPATPATAAMSTAAEQTPPKAAPRRAGVNGSSIGSERSSARFLGVVIAIVAIVVVALVVWFVVGSLR